MIDHKLPSLLRKILASRLNLLRLFIFLTIILLSSSSLISGQIKANVHVIIDKLPIDKQEKMKNFQNVVKDYIENVAWFEEDDFVPVEVTLQMFLTDIPSNVEDRYKCEFLMSSSDVQYFDKRVRFPYQPGEPLVYNEQVIDPLTGVIDFYVNMILGNEFDKESFLGGDFYYKRARSTAALGKFVRTEFIRGWTEREELIQRVFDEPFMTFRKMKDYYFYGLYIIEESIQEARKHVKTALNMIETVMKKQSDLEEPKQFLNAHYLEFLQIFKDDKEKNEVFKKLKELDPEHKELYEEHISES
ncbi:MAG: DUF4835 family protein [bacterium]